MIWRDARKELPRKDKERYLVLIELTYSGKTELRHNICFFSKDLSKVDEEKFYYKKGKSGWYMRDAEEGYYEWSNVVYWSELPPLPGKEESKTETPQRFIEISELLGDNPHVAKGIADFLMSFSNEKN